MTRALWARMARPAGWAAGIGTHLLFVYTVWHLFWFLRNGRANSMVGNLWLDFCLAILFAVPHSLLLWPAVRSRLTRWIQPAFYGLFYTVVTCASLLLLFAFWQGSSTVLWELKGTPRMLVDLGFSASWLALFYSLCLTGLGYQTGLTPWLFWARRQPLPRREFRPQGAYRILRHPVYISFLGLVWFTPHMSLDHVVLTATWTTYLFVGSYLKDRRLTYFLGDTYRDYQSRVPGFPLMPFGPLARLPQLSEESTTSEASQLAA